MDRTLRVGLGAVRRRINNLPPFQDGSFFGVNTCKKLVGSPCKKYTSSYFSGLSMGAQSFHHLIHDHRRLRAV